MRIVINGGLQPPDLTLEDADNFRDFAVHLRGDGHLSLGADVIDRLGTAAEDDEHVFVDRVCLEQLAGDRAKRAEWIAELDAMIKYAEKRGWLGPNGSIRAHVERADSHLEQRT